MAKLGKKARKFAKKNLQSVLKRKRKLNATFKRRDAKKNERNAVDEQEVKSTQQSYERIPKVEDVEELSLDAVFGDDDSGMHSDGSESDGYLSEDSAFMDVTRNEKEDSNGSNALATQNGDNQRKLAKINKKLDRLKAKDPGFSKFLESYSKGVGQFRDEDDVSSLLLVDEDFDENETSDHVVQLVNENAGDFTKPKSLTSSIFSSWCKLVTEQQSVPALVRLLNGYRAACHFGNESSAELAYNEIQDSETFSRVLMFMLHKADGIFRGMLKISSSCTNKEIISELKDPSKHENLKPLIKSYLRSTLYLLNQVADADMLTFSLSRLRASLVLFAPFTNLLHRLLKTAVHLWVTGEGTLSSHSFLIIKDVATTFSSGFFETCLIKSYRAFICQCKFVDPSLTKQVQFLRDCLVELCSQDIEKSYNKATVSIQQLAKILQLGLKTKKKEAVLEVCSWQFVNCVDLWVTFISVNGQDYDFHHLIYMLIQIINGVACLFSGPKYLPLRITCIKWLNQLSTSSGTFIPVASLVLDVLEYTSGKEGGKPRKKLEPASALKLPKHWLKSRNFEEECVYSAIELLAVHFAQWSYHISFPDLAAIPLIRFKKFLEMPTIESLRRAVKRFVENVERNVLFVQKKRDEANFSPKDQKLVESFCQLEKNSGNTPVLQYYRSIIANADSRNSILHGKTRSLEQGTMKKQKLQLPKKMVASSIDGKIQEKRKESSSVENGDGKMTKKIRR